MAKSEGELSTKLANAGANMAPMSLKLDLKSWFDKNQNSMIALWGTEAEARRAFICAMNTISTNERLLQCTKTSLVKALLTASEFRLYPGPMQEAAFVPRFNGKTKEWEAHFEPMFQGLIKLICNTGMATGVSANVVYEGDEFDFEEGTRGFLRHRRLLNRPRGNPLCYYAVATKKDGSTQFIIMDMAEIEAVKKKSQSATKGFGPWEGDQFEADEMGKKTVIKRIGKLLPKSPEFASAIEISNENERPDLAKTALVSLSDSEPRQALPETNGAIETSGEVTQ